MGNPLAHLALLPLHRAAEAPAADCVDDDRVVYTNRDFDRRVAAVAGDLRRRGIGGGDVVAVMLHNRVELVVLMFAAWRVGAALTPLNPALTVAEVNYQLTDSGAKLVVVDRSMAGTAAGTSECPALDVTELPSAADDQPAATAPDVADDLDALALLIYTSGTTGSPKGVMLDHSNLLAMVDMTIDGLALTPDDRSLLILPLFHVNGIVVSVLSPLAAGGAASITGRFSASTFFETVAALRPTYFSAVPTIYAMLTNLPDDQEAPDGRGARVSSLRVAVCGAAPMPPELIGRFEERYGVPIVEGYGLSEGTCASTLNPLDRRKPGTVGTPLPGQEVAIREPAGDDGRGEVIVRGPNVMRGYLNKPEATAETIVDGWLRTGDVGYFDDEGYLVLVDRVKDMIIRGGENIYPKEIEAALYGHPAVAEAAVVGKSHEVYGEEPVAFVSLRPGVTATPHELIEHCRASLAAFKVPRELTVLEALPKNAVGKLSKLPLRERVSS